MIITNENDIYIYFEVIEQLEPQKILDFGMFLKRAGSVSRKVMNREVPEKVRLDGVDFFPETNFPVWKNIYDRITDYRIFFNNGTSGKYDCSILLGIRELQEKVSLTQIINAARNNSRYALISDISSPWMEAGCRIADLKVEDDIYYLVDFGE